MTEDHDFRSDKSESSEGAGVAIDHWRGYHHNLSEDVIAEAFSTRNTTMLELHSEILEELDIRIVTLDGTLLRHLTLDTTRLYQPSGLPRR